MKGQWREQYQKKEWMKSVDIALLFQMEMAVSNMKKVVAAQKTIRKRDITRELETLDKCLAAAQGLIVDFDLTKLQLPPLEGEQSNGK